MEGDHDSQIQTSTFTGTIKAGARSRLLLAYGRTLRPLLWIRVGRDGSVYFGPGKPYLRYSATARRRSSDAALPTGHEPVSDAPLPADFHLSFHASGIVNSIDQRTYRTALRQPRSPQQLCLIEFEHPRYLPLVTQRQRDVVLPFSLDERIPLAANLLVCEPGTVARFGDVPSHQTAVVLTVEGAVPGVRLALQVSLWQRPGAVWRDVTEVTWVSQDPEKHGFRTRGERP